jgi:hypothetical protein
VGGRAIGPRSASRCRPTQLLTKGEDRETSKNHDHGNRRREVAVCVDSGGDPDQRSATQIPMG